MILPLLALALAHASAAPLPSFPGAEGFGATTPGGRGGKILFVTNLNDSGPGSLRAAIETTGPRTILFRVAGVIDLAKPLIIREPFLTIAGQSAPGDGVCTRRSEIRVETHDVIIRYLRVRTGDLAGKPVDGLSIGGDSANVIIDHCSVSWSVDECLSPSGAIQNITVQWCFIGESLNRSVHNKGPHGYGSLVRAIGGLTMHHNLWINNRGRNPRLGDNYKRPPFPTFDVRNNVIYNAGGPSVAGDQFRANYVANYHKPGPDTRTRAIFSPTQASALEFFLNGNIFEGEPKLFAEPARIFTRLMNEGRQIIRTVTQPFDAPAVTTTPAAQAFRDVLARAGATVPVRDAIDTRLAAQARDNRGKIIDSQKQVGEWPVYKSGPVPVDTDNDGIPDEWERRNNLNPKNPADALQGDGYTNLERYLNSLVP